MIPLGVLASAYVAPAASGPLAAAFVTSAGVVSSGTSYTFTGLDIGAAASDREIVVVALVYAGGAYQITGVTIGGTSATIDAANQGRGMAAIARASVPTGTAADITVTASGSGNRFVVGVYRLTGGATVADTLTTNGYATASGTITAAEDGYVIAGAQSTTTNPSWAGVSEDFEQLLSTWYSSGGSAGPTTAGDITVGPGKAFAYSGLAAVAYS